MIHRKTHHEITEKMQRILDCEMDLDELERISLVFLMCDDTVKARSILLKNAVTSRQPKNILPDLFYSLTYNDRQYIDNKIIESLIVIQNYKLVSFLGYTKHQINEMKKMYRKEGQKHYINLVRKSLLEICEKMTNDELGVLVDSVEQDFKKYKCHFVSYGSKHMELNLLYWICEGYISDGTGTRESDVEKLIVHLQKLNRNDLAQKLVKVHETAVIGLEEYQPVLMGRDNDFMERCSDLEVSSNHIIQDEDNIYVMDSDNMGVCIIVNQRNFSKEHMSKNGVHISERHGTDYDRDILNITFTGFGYHVMILENLDSYSLLQSIRKIVQLDVFRYHSSLVLCILSHGKLGAVYCVDGIGVPVEQIEKLISGEECPQLLGKPKFLVIQSCQGNEFQRALPCPRSAGKDPNMLQCDGPTKSMVPPTADVLTFLATVPGYASFRFHHSGSVFIQTLCAQLLKRGDSDHLNDIVMYVNDQISKKQFDSDCKVVMSQVRHTIRKKLYFPYSAENRYKAAEKLYMKYLVDTLIKECIIRAAGALKFFLSKQSDRSIETKQSMK